LDGLFNEMEAGHAQIRPAQPVQTRASTQNHRLPGEPTNHDSLVTPGMYDGLPLTQST
jgi:hypothetical protein